MQLVLKDLVAEKLPRLQSHLDLFTIDVSIVTINWFLTLFVDPLPTEVRRVVLYSHDTVI